jgi:hypothetical protein
VRAAAALAVALLAAPGAAFAQACCGSTGSDDLAILSGCEQAVVAARVGWEGGFGSFDAQGRYAPYDEYAAHDVVWTLGAGTRLPVPSLQIHGSLPVRLQYRRAGGAGDTAAGLGDAAVAARWTALPALDLEAGLRLPTGRAPEDATSPLAADATGAGAWAWIAAIRLKKRFVPAHGAFVDARFERAFERDVGPVRYAPGDALGVTAGWLYVHDLVWSGGVTAGALWHGAASEDGRPVPDGEGHRLRLGAHVTRVLAAPHWDATLNLGVDPWWRDGGANVPVAGPSLALTVRRTWH